MNSASQGPFCQSCAMPMTKSEDFGTEPNGIRSNDYCVYCYKNGAFTMPDVTMEKMRDFCIDKMAEMNVMPREQASALMHEVMPKLKRWTKGK